MGQQRQHARVVRPARAVGAHLPHDQLREPRFQLQTHGLGRARSPPPAAPRWSAGRAPCAGAGARRPVRDTRGTARRSRRGSPRTTSTGAASPASAGVHAALQELDERPPVRLVGAEGERLLELVHDDDRAAAGRSRRAAPTPRRPPVPRRANAGVPGSLCGGDVRRAGIPGGSAPRADRRPATSWSTSRARPPSSPSAPSRSAGTSPAFNRDDFPAPEAPTSMTRPPVRSAARSWRDERLGAPLPPEEPPGVLLPVRGQPPVGAHATGKGRGVRPGAAPPRRRPPAGRSPTGSATARSHSRCHWAMSYSPLDTGAGRARRASGIRTCSTAARAANWAGTFLARRQSLIRWADTRTGRPRSSTRCSRTTASDTLLRGGLPASLYSSARRSAKAVRAPESELKASTPYFPRAWTSGPENSLYMSDLRRKPRPGTGTSSAEAQLAGSQPSSAGERGRPAGPSARALTAAASTTEPALPRSAPIRGGADRHRPAVRHRSPRGEGPAPDAVGCEGRPCTDPMTGASDRQGVSRDSRHDGRTTGIDALRPLSKSRSSMRIALPRISLYTVSVEALHMVEGDLLGVREGRVDVRVVGLEGGVVPADDVERGDAVLVAEEAAEDLPVVVRRRRLGDRGPAPRPRPGAPPRRRRRAPGRTGSSPSGPRCRRA